MMNSKYKVLLSNTIIFAVGNILVKFISFVLMPLYTSVLTVQQYGIAELLNNTIEIFIPLATLCIIEALYRFSIDDNANHHTLFLNSIIVIIIGDAIVGASCLIWFFCSGNRYALYFCALFITTTFYKLTTQFARGLGHVKRYVLYGVTNSLALVLSNIVLLVWLNGGVHAYLLSFSIAYGVSGVLAFILSKEYKFLKVKLFDLKTLKEMFKYSFPSIPNMLSWWINGLSDRYIVLFFWGPGLAGLYTAASKLPALINLITSIFQQAWQYSASKEIGTKDSKFFFTNILRVYVYLCAVVCSGLIVFNRMLCKILLKSDFFIAWQFVPLLLLAATFGSVATYFGTFYNATKNNNMLMISTFVGSICNILLNLFLIPKLGGTGAAIATAISYFAIMIIRIIDVRKFVFIDIYWTKFIFQIAFLAILAVLGTAGDENKIVLQLVCFLAVIFTDYKLITKGIRFLSKALSK